MKLAAYLNCHFTYCTNIHHGESWSEVNQSLRQNLPLVKANISPDQEMGVGLRLSASAASELLEKKEQLHIFKSWLRRESLYVFTINGFPYGRFHNATIKEKVYLPDWADTDRLNYSKQLAEILSELITDDQCGSISTVPVGFKPKFQSSGHVITAVSNLLRLVAYLAELETRSSKCIQYALEPEPGCFLETFEGVINFFQNHIYTDSAVKELAKYLPTALRKNSDIKLIKRYLGVCLDTCHASVMFERPIAVCAALSEADIPIYKIQLTTALSVTRLNTKIRRQLQQFADDTYLHQTFVEAGNSGSAKQFYMDLGPALAQAPDAATLRSHFHVPVFVAKMGELETTQAELVELLHSFKKNLWSQHLEVETYTFDLLPEEQKQGLVVDSISRELFWVREQLAL